MFVGYEIKAQQNQAKPFLLETDIKLSQAVLDPSKGAKKEPVCLMVEYNKKQFIVAVLDSTRSWQCPLDLMFAAGSEVKFFIRGSGTVHLTGFEYRDDMHSELDFETSSEEEEGEEEEDDVEEDKDGEVVERESKVVKKRASKVPVKSAKTNGIAKKDDSKKTLGGDVHDSDEDEDDSDDEDFDSDMMDQDDDIDMSDEDDDEEEDLDDEDVDDESEGDED